MPASTRIFLAISALVLVVLVLYYGVFSGDPAPQTVGASDTPDESQEQYNAVDDAPRLSEPSPGPNTRPSRDEQAVESREAEAAETETPDTSDLPIIDPLEELAPVNLDAAGDEAGDKGDGGSTLGDKGDVVEEEQPNDSSNEDAQPEPAPEPEPEPEPEPAPQPRNPPQSPPQYTQYTVKENDTMSSIAEQWFGDATKWDLIAKANPLVDPARLKIGQTLRLPPKDTEREEVKEAAGDRPIAYTVRSGDTLTKIARAYYGSDRHWRLIYDANRETIGDSPDNLKPGMKITIPPAPGE